MAACESIFSISLPSKNSWHCSVTDFDSVEAGTAIFKRMCIAV